MLWAGIVDSPHVPPRHLALSRANHADGARRPLQHHRPLPARPAGDVHVRGEPVRRAGPGRDRLRGSRRPCRPGPGSGRIRSLPSPSRGTRIGSSTGSNCDHNGQALLALLDGEVDSAGQTPRERPSPWSAGSTTIPPAAPLGDRPSAAPAACWWARQMVESTLTAQVIRPFASASAWSCVRILAQVPSRCQRRNKS